MTQSTPTGRKRNRTIVAFAAEVIEACKEQKIELIAHESLAYVLHTKDRSVVLGSARFLVDKKNFYDLRDVFADRFSYRQSAGFFIVQQRDLRVCIEATDHCFQELPFSLITKDLEGYPFKTIPVALLKTYYRVGALQDRDKEAFFAKRIKKLKQASLDEVSAFIG